MQRYEEIFMERADGLKYQMYALLARPRTQDVSITDLAALLNWKYQSTYNVFQELLTDIVGMSDQAREKVRAQLLAATSLPVTLGDYRIYLVERSLVFQLIDGIIQRPSLTLEQFLAEAYISRSTLTRKIKAARELLARHQIKLKLAGLTLSGDEYSIRACLHTIYWWLYRGSSWPFTAVCQSEVATQAEAIGIGLPQPLERLQQQYFLALCRLRTGTGSQLAADPYLTRLEALIQAHRLRSGEVLQPLSSLDAAAFNFFQLSQPRFDRHARNPRLAAVEIMLLTDPAVAVVSDRVIAALYAVDIAPLDDDVYLNLLRLVAGYVLIGGLPPQDQDGGEGEDDRDDTSLIDWVQEAVVDLPDEAAYAGFRGNQVDFAETVARLVMPTVPAGKHGDDRLRVQLAVSPTSEGYHALAGFVSCVPWVAAVTEGDGDLTITADDAAKPASAAFAWCANALEFAGYRDELIATLINEHARKRQQSAEPKLAAGQW